MSALFESAPPLPSERRIHRRHGAQVAADVLRRGDEALGWVRDLSVQGAHLDCLGPLEEGERVTLLLHPGRDGTRRLVFARVVRVHRRRRECRDLWTHSAAVEFLWPLASESEAQAWLDLLP